MSTLKVDTIDTSNSSGNITVSRPLSGSGASLTTLNASNLATGTVATARLGSGTANNGVFLRGDGTWQTAGSTSASDLTSGTLPIARIADDAITLAKMASGTDGQIITYDASGNPVAIGPGTNGQVLTSTGAGSPPAFEMGSRGSIDGQYSANGTGTITVSSLGFEPKFVSCVAVVNYTGFMSVGFATRNTIHPITASQYCLCDGEASHSQQWFSVQGFFAQLDFGSTNYSRLGVTTWGTDSIVFTKTKTNNHGGASAFNYKINILG